MNTQANTLHGLVNEIKGILSFAVNPLVSKNTPSMSEDLLEKEWLSFEKKLLSLRYTTEDINEIRKAFIFSFVAHLYALKRKSGEPYFYHLLRCALKILSDQKILRIRDKDVIIAVLLHDVVEEAEKANSYFVNIGWATVIVTKNIITMYFGEKMAEKVLCLSKQKWRNESRSDYLDRLITSLFIAVFWAKITDIEDNFDTLESMPIEKQRAKLQEIREKLPSFMTRFNTLVKEGVKDGSLRGSGWLKLCERKRRMVKKSIKKQQHRLKRKVS